MRRAITGSFRVMMILSLTTLLVGGCLPIEDEEGTCEPGSTFVPSDGCGTCKCPESGLESEASCTAIGCVQECTPGEKFLAEDGCNHCVCPENGVKSEAICTADACWDSCKPGETFKSEDGCSTCVCPESGVASEATCTAEACDPNPSCTSNAECAQGQICTWSDGSCGVWGTKGQCTAQPQECVAGGPGVCGCNGEAFTNDCEAAAAGTDASIYGGCQLDASSSSFICGTTSCDGDQEACHIAQNDVVNDGPDFYSNCVSLDDDCQQDGTTSCECVQLYDFETCSDESGLVMVFYPGG